MRWSFTKTQPTFSRSQGLLVRVTSAICKKYSSHVGLTLSDDIITQIHESDWFAYYLLPIHYSMNLNLYNYHVFYSGILKLYRIFLAK